MIVKSCQVYCFSDISNKVFNIVLLAPINAPNELYNHK